MSVPMPPNQQRYPQQRPAPVNARPVSTVRPQSAMAVTSMGMLPNGNAGGAQAERPPSSLSIAWGSSVQKTQPMVDPKHSGIAPQRHQSPIPGSNYSVSHQDGRHSRGHESNPGGSDLRSAWQRLYGSRPGHGMPPSHGQREMVEDSSNPGDIGIPGSFERRSSQRARLQTQEPQPTHVPQSQHFSTGSPVIGRPPTASHYYSGKRVQPIKEFQKVNPHQELTLTLSNPAHNHYQPHDHSSLSPASIGGRGVYNRGRESPTGQSSSNPDQTPDLKDFNRFGSASELEVTNNVSTFKPEKKTVTHNARHGDRGRDVSPTLGPAAKYPQPSSQHLQRRRGSSNLSLDQSDVQNTNIPTLVRPNNYLTSLSHKDASHSHSHRPRSRLRSQSVDSDGTAEFIVNEPFQGHRPSSRGKNPTAAFTASDDEEFLMGEYQLGPLDSVFDFPLEDDVVNQNTQDNCLDGSVSPPLPPLTSIQESLPHYSPRRDKNPHHNTDISATQFQQNRQNPSTSSKGPHLPRADLGVHHRVSGDGYPASSSTHQNTSGRLSPTRIHQQHSKSSGFSDQHQKSARHATRSRSLEDVRESGSDGSISFDIEDTMLMVEPSDQSEMGTLRSNTVARSVRARLNKLEGMYGQVMKTLEERPQQRYNPNTVNSGIGVASEERGGRKAQHSRRRWSIGSSDASSMRKQHRHHHHNHHRGHDRSGGGGVGSSSAGSMEKLSGKNVRVIGKRFQRLESHVITLARSVAHLSSELRSHNSVSREIENVKREIQDLKKSREPDSDFDRLQRQTPGHYRGDKHRLLSEFERYQGCVPSLTNPRRVNKLTKFFGQEPPLLEIFLKRLGYEKYAKNFEDEHIGMIELPYMSEDRLKNIGIPMGPRLRILHEAQVCFQQGNFDVYFV